MTSESTAIVPSPTDNLPDDIKKAIQGAFENLREQAWSNETAMARQNPTPEQPKSWFADPFAVLDSIGMGYRNAPTYLTYDTLRQVSERDNIVASIILTRINQAAAFMRPQPNKYSVGFKIRPRGGDKHRRLTDSEKERVDEIQRFMLDTGSEYNIGRDGLEQFVRKFVRDRLTYDQACFETVRTRGGRPFAFHCVPGDTIRIAQPRILKGTPPRVADLKRDIKYVQVINSTITAEFSIDEMAFCIANPRTHVKVYGYGLPEIEMLMTTITSHLWAEEWNRRLFSQGSTVKGMLNVKGNLPPVQWEAFKRQWYSQVSGVSNAWKTPILNGEDVQWIPLQMNNTEMGYQMWMEYLVKVSSAIFQIDPAEINFDLRGSSGQQPVFMSTNEAQQKVSKDRGLQPLIYFIEDQLNRHVVWKMDPRFEIAFVGLDAKTEEQANQLRMQQVQNYMTLNEVRAMEDLPPLKHGDIVLNPVYSGAVQQAAAAEQQQQAPGGAPGGPPGGQQPGGPPGGGMDPQQMMQMQQGGGQPGGPPQLPPGQAQPSQPYQGRFNGKPHDKEEAAAADTMRNKDEDRSSVQDKKDDDKSSDEVSSTTLRYLHLNDWDSDVHASLKDNDLRKSIQLYDLIKLD